MSRLEEIQAVGTAHHKACYNKEHFTFEWTTINHLGIWAFGGGTKDLPPIFLGARFMVPPQDQTEAWWCYIGPRPDFTNEFDPSPDWCPPKEYQKESKPNE